MKLLQLIKMVLWSFFGVRKLAGLETDAKTANPFHVLLVGILATAAFIGILIAAVKVALHVLI